MATGNIETLIRAAEFIERRDREIEHGYATTLPAAYQHQRQQRVKLGRSHETLHRYTHNELEKSRRANLRRSLERLKDLVPLGPNDTRHTTLSLLENARLLIKVLENSNSQLVSEKQDLMRYQHFCRRKLLEIRTANNTGYRDRHRDESSPVSSITDSTSSEQDTIDVIGSQSSDVDDISSDGDYSVQTSQLSLYL